MPCPAKEFGCGCIEGTCQNPRHPLLDASRAVGSARIITLSVLFGIAITGFAFCLMVLNNPIVLEHAR